MSQLDSKIDEIVRALVRDVAAGVHSLYRGDIRQQTTQLRLSTFAKEAGDKLRATIAGGGTTPTGSVVVTVPAPSDAGAAAGTALSADEVAALTRCVMAWIPLGGAPNAASADMKCASGAREMCPTWGDREVARLALRRVTGGA